MKSILISIKPKYVADILNHKKVIEIRKSYPKCDLPIDVYIYCTKDHKNGLHWNTKKWVCVNNDTDVLKEICLNGKVVAKFILNRIDKCQVVNGWEYNDMLVPQYCLTHKELKEYVGDKVYYEWYISNLEIFDKPRELSEFKPFNNGTPQYKFTKNGCEYITLTKAPQSYCFIETGE